MATQILGADHSILRPRPIGACTETTADERFELHEETGSVFRGFFFAMLFNLLLVLIGATVWEVWRFLR
jgi:hypothetical protein